MVIHADGRDFYTAAEVPDLWADVSPEIVRQWAARGRLNGHRVGRSVYYDANDLTEAEHQARTSTRGSKRGMALTSTDHVDS